MYFSEYCENNNTSMYTGSTTLKNDKLKKLMIDKVGFKKRQIQLKI